MIGEPIGPGKHVDMGGAGAEPHQMRPGFAMMGAQIMQRAQGPIPQPQSAQLSGGRQGYVPNFV